MSAVQTVADLIRQLNELNPDAEVVVQCEHDSFIRYAHVGAHVGATTDHGHRFATIRSGYQAVCDVYPEVGVWNDNDEEGVTE